MWPFKRGKKRENVDVSGLTEARRARIAAEERLAVDQRETIIPLKEMHKENHIQPLIRGLIQKRAERGNAHG